MTQHSWPAIALARSCDGPPRIPFVLMDEHGPVLGSVAIRHLEDCNGYVADASGRPTHLWIARRSLTRPTDPGRLDNLIGGGVPAGQSPREAVVREGWEEAGLESHRMTGLATGSLIDLECDIPEGRQHERLHVFDLALPAGLVPRNIDGEVAEHRLMPVAEALARAAAGELTTDAALATLDFAVRRGLVEPEAGARESTPAVLTTAQLQAFEALRPEDSGRCRGLKG